MVPLMLGNPNMAHYVGAQPAIVFQALLSSLASALT